MMIWSLQIAGYMLFVPLLWQGGNFFTRLLLRLSGSRKPSPAEKPAADAHTLKAGRYIGLLERVLILIGLIFKAWEVMAAVVALKTVARYKELDEQITAEYFLIGSLASILWATLIAGLLVHYDRHCGFGMFIFG